MAELRDYAEIQAEQIAQAQAAVAAAVQTSSGQMLAAELLLAGEVGDTPPAAFVELVTPGPADPPAA